MGKRLDDLAVGDKVVCTFYVRDKARTRELTVKRLNPKSVTTEDSTRWDRNTGREVGDPGYGYSTHIEPFDPDKHPFADAANEARELLRKLERVGMFGRVPNRFLAAMLPHLKAAMAELPKGTIS